MFTQVLGHDEYDNIYLERCRYTLFLKISIHEQIVVHSQLEDARLSLVPSTKLDHEKLILNNSLVCHISF